MNYQFAPALILRMPVKTPGDYTAAPQIFLDDEFFLAALWLASPLFYAALDKKDFRWNRLSEKEAHSLQKYINRYCYRPTPFGLFSAVSLVSWPGRPEPENSAAAFSVHIQTDMAVQQLLTEQLMKNDLRNVRSFEPNLDR